MRILGIESSCDETAAAVVTDDREILSNVIYSQTLEHFAYSGVVPEIAARAHLEKIDLVVEKALNDASMTVSDIDAVAGACGPGLIGGVIVGATFAKAMSLSLGIPFIAVNHIEAHALCARLTNDVKFPYLLLLASGGHCQICIAHGIEQFEVIGKTLDDSVGESFDKVAKMMELGYPGGPAVEKLANSGNPDRFNLPRPLCSKDSLDFSFSGLKTAVRITIQRDLGSDQCDVGSDDDKTHVRQALSDEKRLCESFNQNEQDKADLCASFQRTVNDVLSYKMNAAICLCKSKNIDLDAAVISGGVAANKSIRNSIQLICQKHDVKFCAPPINLCTDNAVMVAWNGVEKALVSKFDDLDFRPRPRWPLKV
ncbi:tRNA N6-adenosine threonylcarbamoyltransferase [Alphaproteobacteria bacterium]|nr:tRNA N6-adenosine threonylcarbamoyltransferase [Alphaproteobacteria bacterium]